MIFKVKKKIKIYVAVLTTVQEKTLIDVNAATVGCVLVKRNILETIKA